MFSLKRILRLGIPFVSIALGVTVYAQIPSHAASCDHPTAMAVLLHKVGMAHLQPCQTTLVPNAVGEWCVNTGHHCNDGSGPGKCLSVYDTSSDSWSCQCVK